MPVESDKLARFTAAIGCGATKDTYPLPLTPEESAAWDRIAAESASLKAKGMRIETPGEWPNPDEDGPAAPAADAAPTAPEPAPAAPAAATPAPAAPAPAPVAATPPA